ncbi:MAG: acetate/propionate family kinase [Paenibacillaceae bacterium]|uniref:acetate/propionate family kinase n=1 Tax=Paenibacillus cymbidii TaxID=1639034 RepID=UPI0010821F9B|nr:acetate/propionate family kinase [Paenibacillus cymbidii]MBO9605291.1 acetate/propionate family kinase [Paenibacillaceae bacterium]
MRTIVGVSNRHIHLTREHVEQLFGKGYALKKLKALMQPGQYACEETVTIHGPKGSIPNVRVLGPERKYSQVEISKTDGYVLGIDAPVRDSGDLDGTPGIRVSGPNGEVALERGVILPYRHLHLHPDDADMIGVKDKEMVAVKTTGVRAVILENVLCRVNPNYALEFHIDTDEANACGLRTGDTVQIVTVDGYHERHTFTKKRVLVLNFGSSSVKYKVFDMPSERIVRQGRIDLPADVDAIFEQVGADIDIVAHRVVHGADLFQASALITDDVYGKIDSISHLAPLHNPMNLYGVRIAREHYRDQPHYAVFDTSFHQTMPPTSYLYSLPYEYYEQHKIRKYGFHGSSHRYVMERAAQIMGRPVDQLKLISCHIGNGVSITAIRNGESYDTSMGFTPLAGVAMGTRSGNIDPSIIPYLEQAAGLNTAEVMNVLNHQSGLLGISGISNDIRVLLDQARDGHPRAMLAIDMFVARIHQFIGLYFARLNGADGLIFTAGIGENSSEIREKVCQGLEFAGIYLDAKANWEGAGERLISSPYSPVKVMVIPTNEEIIMARDAYRLAALEQPA